MTDESPLCTQNGIDIENLTPAHERYPYECFVIEMCPKSGTQGKKPRIFPHMKDTQ